MAVTISEITTQIILIQSPLICQRFKTLFNKNNSRKITYINLLSFYQIQVGVMFRLMYSVQRNHQKYTV